MNSWWCGEEGSFGWHTEQAAIEKLRQVRKVDPVVFVSDACACNGRLLLLQHENPREGLGLHGEQLEEHFNSCCRCARQATTIKRRTDHCRRLQAKSRPMHWVSEGGSYTCVPCRQAVEWRAQL